MVQDISFCDIKIGDQASMSKTISESDIYGFAGITGDFNPIHVNEEFSKTTFFKTRIAHGMLSAGLISAVLGTALPGINTIYMKQSLNFIAPVKLGDTITATIEVIEKIEEKHRIILKTIVTNQYHTIVTDGQATVMKK